MNSFAILLRIYRSKSTSCPINAIRWTTTQHRYRVAQPYIPCSMSSSTPQPSHRYVLIYPRGIAGPPPPASVELGYDDRQPPVYELSKGKGKELDGLEAEYEDPQLAFSELGELVARA